MLKDEWMIIYSFYCNKINVEIIRDSFGRGFAPWADYSLRTRVMSRMHCYWLLFMCRYKSTGERVNVRDSQSSTARFPRSSAFGCGPEAPRGIINFMNLHHLPSLKRGSVHLRFHCQQLCWASLPVFTDSPLAHLPLIYPMNNHPNPPLHAYMPLQCPCHSMGSCTCCFVKTLSASSYPVYSYPLCQIVFL